MCETPIQAKPPEQQPRQKQNHRALKIKVALGYLRMASYVFTQNTLHSTLTHRYSSLSYEMSIVSSAFSAWLFSEWCVCVSELRLGQTANFYWLGRWILFISSRCLWVHGLSVQQIDSSGIERQVSEMHKVCSLREGGFRSSNAVLWLTHSVSLFFILPVPARLKANLFWRETVLIGTS